MKKIVTALLALLLITGIIPAFCVKAEEELKNVKLSEDGILTWDAFNGDARYIVVVGSTTVLKDNTSCNLYEVLANEGYTGGTYDVVLYAVNNDNERISEMWTGRYTYAAPLSQLETPSNVRWNGSVVSWDPVPNAEEYIIIIDTMFKITHECSADVSGKLAEGNQEYTYEIYASAQGYPDSDHFVGTIELNVLRDALKNVSITENGIMTWDAWPDAYAYNIGVGTAGGSKYFDETYINLYELCSEVSFESGTYDVYAYAVNVDGDYLSGKWKGTYKFEKGRFYVVKFKTDSGSGFMQSINVPVGTSFTLPENGFEAPSRKEFDCWEIEDYGTFAPGTSFQPSSDLTVNAVWKEGAGDPSEYTATLDRIDCGEETEEYTETAAYTFRVFVTGSRNLIRDPEHYRIEFSGDTDAFDLWAADGGTLATENAYNAGSVKPKEGLKAGTYTAYAKLYYDPDGFGSNFESTMLADAEFTFTVKPEQVLYDIYVATYDASLETGGSGGQVSLETDEGTNGFQNSGYGFSATEGTVVKIKAAAKEGYEFVEWRNESVTGPVFTTEAEYEFTASGELNLYAIFKKTGTGDNTPTPAETDKTPTPGENSSKTPTPKGNGNDRTDDYDDSDKGNGLLIFLIIAGSVVVVAGVVVAVVLAKKKKK